MADIIVLGEEGPTVWTGDRRQSTKSGFKEESHMYITDVVWWGYTIFLAAVALFMIYFFLKVRQKGG